MNEVKEIVTRQYKCPICGYLFDDRKAAEFCAKAPYEPLAKPGDEVKLKNRNHGYTVATVISIKPASRLRLLSMGPSPILIAEDIPEEWAHDTIATLADSVHLDHKWEDYHDKISLNTYLVSPEDHDYQKRMEHGRDDNNSW